MCVNWRTGHKSWLIGYRARSREQDENLEAGNTIAPIIICIGFILVAVDELGKLLTMTYKLNLSCALVDSSICK